MFVGDRYSGEIIHTHTLLLSLSPLVHDLSTKLAAACGEKKRKLSVSSLSSTKLYPEKLQHNQHQVLFIIYHFEASSLFFFGKEF